MSLRSLFKKYWFFVLIPVAVIVFLIYMMSREDLQVFDPVGGEAIQTVLPERETEQTLEEEMQTYTAEKVPFSIDVPVSWSGVLKGGNKTFVHPPSSSAVSIQVLDYYPQVNNCTGDSLAEEIYKNGYTVTNFEKTDASSYILYYQSSNENGVIDYIDYVTWDRQHVVKVTFTIRDTYYDKMSPVIDKCFLSIKWEKEDPVPEGTFIAYDQLSDIEFGVPSSWQYGWSENAFYAMDDQTGANMTVNFMEDESPIDAIDQAAYADYLGSGKNSFMLQMFDHYSGSIYAEASYISPSDNTQTDIMQLYMADGRTHCAATFEVSDTYINDYYDVFRACLACVRSFYIPTEHIITSDELETEGPESSEIETDAFGEIETEKEVATFKDALVAVTGIEMEKASAIEDIWNQLEAGTPSNAKPLKENEDSFILYIQTYEGNVYYMTIKKTGELENIRINSENGPILYSSEK